VHFKEQKIFLAFLNSPSLEQLSPDCKHHLNYPFVVFDKVFKVNRDSILAVQNFTRFYPKINFPASMSLSSGQKYKIRNEFFEWKMIGYFAFLQHLWGGPIHENPRWAGAKSVKVIQNNYLKNLISRFKKIEKTFRETQYLFFSFDQKMLMTV